MKRILLPIGLTLMLSLGLWAKSENSSHFVQDKKKNNSKSSLEEKIKLYIRQLSHNEFQVREKATKALMKIGKPAVPYLKQALKSSSPEVQWRAKKILSSILKSTPQSKSSKEEDEERFPFPTFRLEFEDENLNKLLKELRKWEKEMRYNFKFEKYFDDFFKGDKEFERFYGETLKRMQELFKRGLAPRFRFEWKHNFRFPPRIEKFFKDNPFKLSPTIPRTKEFSLPPMHGQGIFRIYRNLNGKQYWEEWKFENGKWKKIRSSQQPPSKVEKFRPQLRVQPPSRSKALLGIAVEPISADLQKHLGISNGLLVRRVQPNSLAEKSGIRPYDILLKIDGRPIQGVEDILSAMKRLSTKPFELTILRKGKLLRITIKKKFM